MKLVIGFFYLLKNNIIYAEGAGAGAAAGSGAGAAAGSDTGAAAGSAAGSGAGAAAGQQPVPVQLPVSVQQPVPVQGAAGAGSVAGAGSATGAGTTGRTFLYLAADAGAFAGTNVNFLFFTFLVIGFILDKLNLVLSTKFFNSSSSLAGAGLANAKSITCTVNVCE
jgi:hypothetical protein